MNNYLDFNIEPKCHGYKVQVYMREILEFSSRFCRKTAKEGRVKINARKATLFSKLFEGDILRIYLPEEDENIVDRDKMDLNILYEDDLIIAVEKTQGILVHPTMNFPRETLLNGIAYYLFENGIKTMPRLVSRLDRDTTGVIVIAKNSFGHMRLARAMENNTYRKEYFAIVHGIIQRKSDTIDKPIHSIEGEIKRFINEDGKESITKYDLISTSEDASLVKLKLITGRTHQIRVHMSSIGHPLYGDSLYGEDEFGLIDRQALHAYSVEFPHPIEKKILRITCPLPHDMNELIRKLSLEKRFL